MQATLTGQNILVINATIVIRTSHALNDDGTLVVDYHTSRQILIEGNSSTRGYIHGMIARQFITERLCKMHISTWQDVVAHSRGCI